MNTSGTTQLSDSRQIELVRQLVAIDSWSGQEANASRFLVEQFESLGFDQAYVDTAGSAVGIRGTGVCTTTIVLLGHIDTVPGSIPVRIENDVLYGRGSVDAKGPLATFALAAAMAERPPGVRLVVVGAVEEESATSKGARQIGQDFSADFCVIGEPSSAAAITLGYKGRILFDYDVTVDMGHSAGPDRGAAEYAAEFWQNVLDYCQRFNETRKGLFDQLLPSLRKINSSSDGMESKASCKIGVRLPPEFDIEQFRDQLVGFANVGNLSSYGYEPAHRADRSNPLCGALARAIREAGFKPSYKLKTGTADMNVVAPIWQCPILAYGPGDSSLDHTPNEHLQLSEFLQAVRILTHALNLLFSKLKPPAGQGD